MVARALRPTSPGWTPSQWIYQSWRQRGKRRSSSADHASSSDVLLSPYILSLSCDLSMYRVFKHSCFVPGGAILWHYELCHKGLTGEERAGGGRGCSLKCPREASSHNFELMRSFHGGTSHFMEPLLQPVSPKPVSHIVMGQERGSIMVPRNRKKYQAR